MCGTPNVRPTVCSTLLSLMMIVLYNAERRSIFSRMPVPPRTWMDLRISSETSAVKRRSATFKSMQTHIVLQKKTDTLDPRTRITAAAASSPRRTTCSCQSRRQCGEALLQNSTWWDPATRRTHPATRNVHHAACDMHPAACNEQCARHHMTCAAHST